MSTKAKTIMIQGTASSVGKSVLVTALCRILKQDGYKVAPFKAQNMSLNSFVTAEGGEIGRAQAVQAEAAGIPSSVDMNPVLLKPEADSRSQVVVLGKVMSTIDATHYYGHKEKLLEIVTGALDRLRSAYDIVVIEGAGSPAEVNMKATEIVNMRIARLAGAPVLLAGDIDRGGVFAALVGTLELLEPDERQLVRGFIINKFRGDVSLLQPGLDFLEDKTGKPVLGVVPYFRDIAIAQEDSVYLDERPDDPRNYDIDIAVIRLPHISNYDDFDPLEASPGCRVRYVADCNQLGSPGLIVIPGSKSTINDLDFLWASGLAEAIIARAEGGTPVLGICGGYQMLGRKIEDQHQVESVADCSRGLGLLDMATVFGREKRTSQVRARVVADKGILAGLQGQELEGYEIHMGRCPEQNEPAAFQVFQTPQGATGYADGAVNARGNVIGTYIHGLFNQDSFCRAFVAALRRYHGLPQPGEYSTIDRQAQYNRLAELVRRHLDMERIYMILEEA